MKFGTEEDLRGHTEASHQSKKPLDSQSRWTEYTWDAFGLEEPWKGGVDFTKSSISQKSDYEKSGENTESRAKEVTCDIESDVGKFMSNSEIDTVSDRNVRELPGKSSRGDGVVRWYPNVSPVKKCSATASVKTSLMDLESRFGKYASTINICDNVHYFCQVCSLKFEHERQCEDHFSGGYHRMRVDVFENTPKSDHTGEKEIGNSSSSVINELLTNSKWPASYDDSFESSRSRRKRSWPKPCRRESGSEVKVSEDESSEDNSDSDSAVSVSWMSSHPVRYSLMQSDRKRLTLAGKDPKFSPGRSQSETEEPGVDSGAQKENDPKPLPESISGVESKKENASVMADVYNTDVVLNLSCVKPDLDANFNETDQQFSSKHVRPSGSEMWKRLFGGLIPVELPGYLTGTSANKGSPSDESGMQMKVEGRTHRCNNCQQEFDSVEEFCTHYRDAHLSTQQALVGDQQFKVMWLKQLLPRKSAHSFLSNIWGNIFSDNTV